jgi:glycosyltransferase involved in cell wall biosynthesis
MSSICFVAHNAYGALAELDTGHIGGIERQQSLIAQWLANQGHDVSMVTWDEGQGDCEIKGIKVFTLGRREEGLPGLRFFHPRWTGLDKAMKRANSDIYHYHCGDLGLGQVVLWANRYNKKTVYSVASNPDCDPELPALKPWRERVLYRYGLLRAELVVAQTLRQQEMLQSGFGVRAKIVPMPCAGLGNKYGIIETNQGPPHILWVGRFSQEKRLEWLLDVAEVCPQYVFDVAGAANAHTDYARALLNRAESIPNVVIHGRVTDHELEALYRCARLLCCTSIFEGFPNTFLEAWSIGLPIVSTFDPDNIIASEGLGKKACSVDAICQDISAFIENQRDWQTASAAAKIYFNSHHTLEAVMPKFVELFQKLER